jgi:hypothetical protein
MSFRQGNHASKVSIIIVISVISAYYVFTAPHRTADGERMGSKAFRGSTGVIYPRPALRASQSKYSMYALA